MAEDDRQEGRAAASGPPAAKRRRWRVLPTWRRMLLWLLPLALMLLFLLSMTTCLPHRRGDLPGGEGRREGASLVRARIESHVRALAEGIGPRPGSDAAALERAEGMIREALEEMGHEPVEIPYLLGARKVRNLEVIIPGSDPSLGALVVGAHYDTVPGTPGADDNASGVALLIELARSLKGARPPREIRLVAFPCEEPGHFQSDEMGSLHYARRLVEQGVRVEAMISLESLGYYNDEPASQQYPPGLSFFYPDRGNFVAVVGNLRSRSLVKRVAGLIREHTELPLQSGALPGFLPGIGWSDHWSFWKIGVPAVMLTDTAPFRNPHYHRPTDTPDTLSYDVLAALGEALPRVVLKLAGE